MQTKNLQLSIRKICFDLEALKSNLDEKNQASVTENLTFGIERFENGNNLFGLFGLLAFRCRNRNEWCLNHFLISLVEKADRSFVAKNGTFSSVEK